MYWSLFLNFCEVNSRLRSDQTYYKYLQDQTGIKWSDSIGVDAIVPNSGTSVSIVQLDEIHGSFDKLTNATARITSLKNFRRGFLLYVVEGSIDEHSPIENNKTTVDLAKITPENTQMTQLKRKDEVFGSLMKV